MRQTMHVVFEWYNDDEEQLKTFEEWVKHLVDMTNDHTPYDAWVAKE